VEVYGPRDPEAQVAVVSFNVLAPGRGGVLDPALVAETLDTEFGVMVRAGLQCGPWAHRTVGTYPQGAVRISLGYSNTPEEVAYIVSAVGAIAGGLTRAR